MRWSRRELRRELAINFSLCRAQKVEIAGAPSGILSGKRIAIKDNIAVAGVPMENGSKMWQGYTPEYDATVVTRILDAGETSNK